MNDQKRSDPLSPLGREFDKFLFASINEDQNGMLLSVNSALARLNIDPWDEAATLARLPQDKATRRLTTLIAALPEGSATQVAPEKIAERLVALLPHRVATLFEGRTTLQDVRSVIASPSGIYLILIVVFIFLIVALQWLDSDYTVPAEAGQAPAPIAMPSPVPNID